MARLLQDVRYGLGEVLQDIHYGMRMLIKHPGFTIVAIVTLALGIGANTAIFSVVDAVLFRPLPYPESEQLIRIHGRNAHIDEGPLSVVDLQAIIEHKSVFETVAGYASVPSGFTLTGGPEPQQVSATVVTADFFSTLRIQPVLGRTFESGEDQPGKERVAVISHAFWEQHLGGDASCVGQVITLNALNYTVIGVLPLNFVFPPASRTEVWPIVQLDPPTWHGPFWLAGIARLKQNTGTAQAQTELEGVRATVNERWYGDPSADWYLLAVPFKEHVVGNVRTALLVLLGAVGLVLLISCANVANLMLVRTNARQKELAIRASVGASRSRLTQQLLTESLLLSTLGGAVGVGLALSVLSLFTSVGDATLPRVSEIRIDARVLGFTMFVSTLSAVLFGLAPALQGGHSYLNTTLKEAGRAGAGRNKRWLSRALIISEYALSLMLLVGAGLLIKSFLRLHQVDVGFDREDILTAHVSLPEQRYEESSPVSQFYDELLERVRNLPGVRSAAVTFSLPPDKLFYTDGFLVEGQSVAVAESRPMAQHHLVSPDLFETLGIQLLEGRLFNEHDTPDTPQVAIINRAMARRYFPDQYPIGKRLQIGVNPDAPWKTIVGVVGNVKFTGLDAGDELTIYSPHPWHRMMFLVARTSVAPLSVVPAIRREVKALDPKLPLNDVKTMNQRVAESLAQERYRTVLMGAFAAVAVLLAAVGIYGVMSYAVSQRTHEIGVRIALGARSRDILGMVVREGLLLTLLGVLFGLAGALALARVMSGLLFEVSPVDFQTFATVSVLLAVVAAFACLVPARKAMKVDPIVALRYE